jgi:D-tyrosyl-tRNA(Tyr) deacylase
MRAVVQRASRAEVRVGGEVTGRIERGLVVLLGVRTGDTERDADYLVVSQFTLYGDTRKGRRPSFIEAAPPEIATTLYDYFVERARARGLPVATGVFQAMMEVDFVNEGPVTLIVESK